MAFCFYNLSSIINGLVYFNQITLISTVHLFLVGVGIIVLLGGVWVVSVQSGEGGIDVGTWAENDREARSDGEREENHVNSPREDHPGERERENEREDAGETGVEWRQREGAMSKTHAVAPILTKSPDRTSGALGLGHPSTRHRSIVTPPSPLRQQLETSHTHPSRSVSDLPRMSYRRPRVDSPSFARGLTLPSSHSRPHSQVSALGGGFQIGLSPVSPGFMILPRERRRRVSVLSVERGSLVEGMGTRRRTVSEGDLRRQIAMAEQAEQGEGDDIEAEGSHRGERGDGTSKRGWAWWLYK